MAFAITYGWPKLIKTTELCQECHKRVAVYELRMLWLRKKLCKKCANRYIGPSIIA